jgi:glycosyltransferase involved in cell wall biosynthesis
VLRRLRSGVQAARVGVREAPRWWRLRRAPMPTGGVHVYYGGVPRGHDVVSGGAVKLSRLAETFPNEPERWNVLYLGSSALPVDARTLVRIAEARGARFVLNQDGVLYPGLGMRGWERANDRAARLLHASDYVFFQSAFSKESSERFLGERSDRWEILYNAVDTSVFVPAPERREGALTMLLGGSQYQRYRVEAALRTLALLPDARLIVTGALSFAGDAERLIRELGIGERVDLTGPYAQEDAPALMQRAHVLLHTKYNDPCPGVVVEAMACGLPVVYSRSGGVPELVGDDAGVGVPAPADFERDHPPAPQELADAVRSVASRLDEYAAAARARAVERFDIRPWIERHRQVFAELVS